MFADYFRTSPWFSLILFFPLKFFPDGGFTPKERGMFSVLRAPWLSAAY